MRGLIGLTLMLSALGASAMDVSGRRMVWAHYVPWYTPDNASQIAYRFHSYPQESVGADPFRAEIERALAQGIDGFFNDMVAHKGGSTSYWDLRPFLQAAEGTPFQFGICLDAKTTVEHQVKELVKMLSTYGNHPNYPKWGNRYVVDTYTFLKWTPDEWLAIRKGCEDAGYPIYVIANVETGFAAFDAEKLKPYAGTFERAYHFAHYGMDRERFKSIERETEECAKFCEANGAVYMPCVWPGYYGAWMAGFNCFYQPFLGFDMAQRRFDTWRLVKNADWLHVTTYNDHGETAMMPRRHVTGNRAIVKAMSDEFKGVTPPERVDVQFAYLREVMPGTMLRFGAMRLPTTNTGTVTVSGVLRDASGKIVCRLGEKKFANNGWDRLEWLISTTEISATPYLAPEFAVREGNVYRTVRPPKVFLVTGWLEDPVTVKVSVDDYAVISNRLGVSWSNGVLRARCAFIADTKVRRAVLFRNNRPLTTFQPNAGKTLNVYFRGGNDVELKAGNTRVVRAVKSFERNGARNFVWDEKRIISRRTPSWMLMSARIEANGMDELLFSSSGQSVRFTPLELAQKGAVSVGSGKIWMDADGTTYDLPPLDAGRGGYTAEVWTKKPEPNDAYWVEFELANGRIAESDVLYPFADSTVPVEINVVETPITFDHTSGASGAPDTVEFFTPKTEWPVKEMRVVKTKVSPQSIRRRVFTKGQKVPARCWPMGSFSLTCEFVSSVEGGKDRPILSPDGWNEGPSLVLLGDGRLKATYASELGSKCEVVGRSPLRVGQSVAVELKSDCKKMSLAVDGVSQGSCEVPVMRVYGNCSPFVDGSVQRLAFEAGCKMENDGE